MIYFIQDRLTLLIKIGYTAASPEQRMKELQTGTPGKLTLLLSIEGDLDDEKSYHRKFSGLRERGEWFRPEPELLAKLTDLAIAKKMARAAFQLIDEPVNDQGRTAGLFGKLTIVEELPDGRKVRVEGMKNILAMTDDEFDDFEAAEAATIRTHGRALNAKRILRNRETNQQRLLPFPEFENGDCP
jgi:hypothetical protein